MNANSIPKDKYIHFAVGTVAFTAVYMATRNPTAAIIGVGLAAVGKELYDGVTGRGTPDVNDALATLAGGMMPWTVAYLS